MKFDFEIRSIASESQSIGEKHFQFLSALEGMDVPEPWRVRERVLAPDPGSGLSASVGVSKFLGSGLRGEAVYQFRRAFRDEAAHDDWLDVIFDPVRLDYKQLVYRVFMNYVAAFQGYYAEIADDEFIFKDREERRRLKVDKRHSVYRLAPISYIDERLCKSAFGVDVATAVKRLEGHVELARAELSGLFVILTSDLLSLDEMDQLCWKSKERLLSKH